MNDNPLDEKFLDWFSGCYRTNAASMPDAQRRQLEMAFYAGAACGTNVERNHGPGVVKEAIDAHLERVK